MTPLLLDGVDVAQVLGVGVESQGWNALLSWPPVKEYAVNDWHEEDGIQPDLSSPVVATKEAAVSFYAPDRESMREFVDRWITLPAYHALNAPGIERQFNLRLVRQSGLSVNRDAFSTATLVFSLDTPPTVYATPVYSLSPVEDYLIDARPFTDFGCRILKGTLAEILRLPDVKPNLVRDSRYSSGVEYDPAWVKLKSKDAKLYCYMTAPTLGELWRNYYALLYWLTRPGERLLTVRDLNEASIPCAYKSAQVTEFYPRDKIWLVFNITLTFINQPRN